MVEARSIYGRVLIFLLFVMVVVFNLLPIAWGALASLKPASQLVTYPPTLFDFNLTLKNYEEVIAGGFLTGMRNSLFYAIVSIAIGLIVGALAAFGFDRFVFRGQASIFLLVVGSIPLAMGAAALVVPTYLYFTWLGLTNDWYTLPLIYGVHTLPMAIWILKGSMEGVPSELDEAAYIDGASSFTVLSRIVLPLCKPAIGAAGLFLFISAWNEFLAGSVMVDAKHLKPIQPLLHQYIGFFGREWGALTAAAIIATIPILIAYILFGRLLVSGLTQGATKG